MIEREKSKSEVKRRGWWSEKCEKKKKKKENGRRRLWRQEGRLLIGREVEEKK